MFRLVCLVLAILPSLALAGVRFSPDHGDPRSLVERRYSRAHSLGDRYVFDVRDGWQSVNVSNLQYKYEARGEVTNLTGSSENHGLSRRAPKKSAKTTSKGITDTVKTAIKDAIKGLKGIGKAEPVTITWYTGHDLLNPSCWANTKWAPTDASFACALTLEGWTSKPQCFKFLELCHTPKTCVFVRVVDTCAGCAKGSRHVDLTRSAFGQLAPYDEGVLTVQMRGATEPDDWFENLWGPKA
ncbi:hypothetical protein BV25DRAFT_1986668 [Artomyces pyxidatus]|uniref:Uncharacterized protein n=1 Tax=Artomyces pyxidatus TaxID=48021 RepID=A0ACB8TL69_9AGAM|nr:hypothetical protein BV25DRAFT_1986668 [Artomyces pyxidatus]